MKESNLISGAIILAAIAFLVAIIIGDAGFNSTSIPIILIITSFLLTFLGLVFTFIFWKRIKPGTRIVGIVPFVLFVALVAVFIYSVSKMD